MTTRDRRYALLAGVCVAANVAVAAVGTTSSVGPALPDAAWSTATGIVGTVFAVTGWLASRLSVSPAPARLSIAASVAWMAGGLVGLTERWGYVWPLFAAIEPLWIVLVNLLILVYPTGRFSGPVHRLLVGLAAVGLTGRGLAVLLLGSPPQQRCACVPSAYQVWDDPALAWHVEAVFRLGGLAMIAAVTVWVVTRWLRDSPAGRRAALFMPVAMVCWTVVMIHLQVATLSGAAVPGSLLILYLGAIAAVPLSHVAGLSRAAHAREHVADFLLAVGTESGLERWQEALRAAVGDPTLRIVPPADLATGVQVEHDPALAVDSRLVAAIRAALALLLENSRLTGRLERTVEEVTESRRRIVESEDAARRALERDLHDGSQQLLVTLSIRLAMAGRRAEALGDAELVESLAESSRLLAAALDGLRELAHGMVPAVLAAGGLGAALSELALRSALPVRVEWQLSAEPALSQATTAYYVVAEALTNAAKHARAATCVIRVQEHDGGGIRLVVDDDGVGGAAYRPGGGLRGLADRRRAAPAVTGATARSGARPVLGPHR